MKLGLNKAVAWTLLLAALPTHVGCGTAARRSIASDGIVNTPPPSGHRHVHLMHLDGFRGDLFQKLVESGQMPAFSELLARGRVSYRASTVDKSETMKVIESYLTSRRDTSIAGWWQFNRETFTFKNFWLDPVEVVNYALGFDFPLYPTVLDVVAGNGGGTMAGFSLHRRGVPFNRYSRAYAEGAASVFKHTYYEQLHATMGGVIRMFEKIKAEGGQPPRISTSLLAAADEFAHLEGPMRSPRDRIGPTGEYCYQRGKPDKSGNLSRLDEHVEQAFRYIDEDNSQAVAHFRNIKMTRDGKASGFCIKLPKLVFHAHPSPRTPASSGGVATEDYAAPNYALGMILIDWEVAALIKTLKGFKLSPEESLYDHTLFAVTGDHGFVDTRHMMEPVNARNPDPHRDPRSSSLRFVEWMNKELRLSTAAADAAPPAGGWGNGLGIDDAHLPSRLRFPHKDKGWQTPSVQAMTSEAEAWAEAFFQEVRDQVKDDLHAKYWWMLFFKSLLIDPKLDGALAEYKPRVVDTLARVYLRGLPQYVAAEREANRKFYDESVRFVYGGGARNNAEIFLPATVDGRPSWSRRPTTEEILRDDKLMRALKSNPATALIFIRKDNDEYSSVTPAAVAPVTGRRDILVMDRHGNQGTISVWRDEATQELVYRYQVDSETGTDPLAFDKPALGSASGDPMRADTGMIAASRDPLGYGRLGLGQGTVGTYNEWNELSLQADHTFHNVVAGMGSYLYSNNPAIGDVTLMHAQGWNYGENAGGHGGIHKEEKLTVMMLSGPGIVPGELKSRASLKTTALGKVVREEWNAHPTVVDLAPTILDWLGYGPDALAEFAKSGAFEEHFQKWVSGQRAEILTHMDSIEGLEKAKEAIGVPLRLSHFRDRIERLLQFIPAHPPGLPDYTHFKADGNQLRY